MNAGGHRRVEVPTARHADADDQSEEHEEVDQAHDRVVGSELGVLAGRYVERDDAGDEEDQEQRADQFGDVRSETSILHLKRPPRRASKKVPTGRRRGAQSNRNRGRASTPSESFISPL